MTDNLIYLNENNVLVHSDSITINNVAIKNSFTIGNIQSTGQLNVKESIKIDGNINRKMENIEYQNINMNTNIVGNNINIYCKTIDLNMKDMIVSKPQVLLSDGINCTWGDYIDNTIPNNNTNSMLLDYQTVKYNVNFDTVVITNNPSINNTCIISEDSQLASPLYIKFDIDANTITDDFDYTTSDLTDFNLDINGSSNTITKVEYKEANMEFNINYSSPRIYKDDIVKLSYTGSLINPFSNIQFGNSSTTVYNPSLGISDMTPYNNAYMGFTNTTLLNLSNNQKFAIFNKHYKKFLKFDGSSTFTWTSYDSPERAGHEAILNNFSFVDALNFGEVITNSNNLLYKYNKLLSIQHGSTWVIPCDSSGNYTIDANAYIGKSWHQPNKMVFCKTTDGDNSFWWDGEFGWHANTSSGDGHNDLMMMRAYMHNGVLKLNAQNNISGGWSGTTYNIQSTTGVPQTNMDEFKWFIYLI
tara:strand:+ start:3651 stop:5066 length:1416 start_codon:yes stop_codon:yes gene_type:complete